MADWRSDAASFDSATQAVVSGTGSTVSTSTAIPKVIAELILYQAPTPCIQKNQGTFTVTTGTPAALSCGSSSSPPPASSNYQEPLNQTQDQSGGTFR